MQKSKYFTYILTAIVIIIAIALVYVVLQPKRVLPIYNPSDLNPAVVDDDLERKGRGHRIGDGDVVFGSERGGHTERLRLSATTIGLNTAKNSHRVKIEPGGLVVVNLPRDRRL